MRLPAAPLKRSSDWVLQLINIVFLLLLFFLANGTIAGQGERQVVLPTSVLTQAGNPPGDAVYIDANGRVTFRGSPSTIAELAAVLRAERAGAQPGPKAMQIAADHRLPATALVDALQEFRRLGFDDLTLVTMKDTGR